MQLEQLKYFCAVVQYGSISRAAEVLWISQSALSKAIISLEDELGVRLFDRIGRKIILNDAGRMYYLQIDRILLLVGDATKQVRDLFERSANSVTLLLSAANFISGWIWRRFHEAYPEIKLQINSCYDVSQHDISQSDFHVFATPAAYDNVDAVLLMEEELMLAMSPKHPLASAEEVRLIDTKGYPFQTLSPHENLRENLSVLCGASGFQPDIAFSTADSFTFFDMLASNEYLALVPETTAGTALHGKLVLKKIAEPQSKRVVYLSWNKNRFLSQSARTFRDFCKDLFSRVDLKAQIQGN